MFLLLRKVVAILSPLGLLCLRGGGPGLKLPGPILEEQMELDLNTALQSLGMTQVSCRQNKEILQLSSPNCTFDHRITMLTEHCDHLRVLVVVSKLRNTGAGKLQWGHLKSNQQ